MSQTEQAPFDMTARRISLFRSFDSSTRNAKSSEIVERRQFSRADQFTAKPKPAAKDSSILAGLEIGSADELRRAALKRRALKRQTQGNATARREAILAKRKATVEANEQFISKQIAIHDGAPVDFSGRLIDEADE